MKKMAAIVILLLGLLLCGSAWAEAVNRALLVGCDSFVTLASTAPSSANNVSQMAQVFSGGSLNVERLITRRTGVSGMEELAELMSIAYEDADADDVSYLYLSTHGLWSPDQPNADMTFVLSNGREEEGMTARQLRRLLDTVPGRKVVLLDACHSGAAIGKGTSENFANVFTGSDYVVICSSGGMEESWIWTSVTDDEQASKPGSGYFSGAVASGLSVLGGYAADSNRDGSITLTELKRYLREEDGASTVQTYPETGDITLMTYDAESFDGRARGAALQRLTFEGSALSDDEPEAAFSFTVLEPTRLAYLLVNMGETRWDFSAASTLWDEGDDVGVLYPGYHERSVSLLDMTGADGGYILLEMITWPNGAPRLSGCRLLCVIPSEGDPELSVRTEALFAPETGDELGLVVYHALPCRLTVTVENAAGDTVCRLASSQPSRPEQLSPAGSTFYWNGLLSDGTEAPAGSYRIRAGASIGGVDHEAVSEDFELIRTQIVTPRREGK